MGGAKASIVVSGGRRVAQVTLALLVHLAACGQALGQEPLDMLDVRSPDERTAEFAVSVSYVPAGQSGIGVDGGRPYSYVRQGNQFRLAAGIDLPLFGGLGLTLSAVQEGQSVRERRLYTGFEQTTHAAETNPSGLIGVRWHRRKGRGLRPAASVSYRFSDRGLSFDLSGTHVRDPLALKGSVTFQQKTEQIHAVLDVGFVANDRFSLGFLTSAAIPLGRVDEPVTAAGVRLTCSLPSLDRAISLESAMAFRGGRSAHQFTVGYTQQFPIRSK